MRNPVSNLPWISARVVPCLPPICACGATLDLEMEKDEGRCVDCSFQAAEAAYRGQG